ncbi:MAG: VCBS domain-containing protein [Reyranella sp.]|uniref:VCBS domain-containing protein n=1 Tax=Reyranella sp. TaxID=1929291 RepID=UPI003D1363BE
MDAAGIWHYTVTVPPDALAGGMPHSDSFVVTSADGTATTVTVNILTATRGGGEGDGSFRVDTTFLAPFIGFVVRGDEAGWSVSAAGDVNGDGYADVIVGAPTDDDDGGDAGEAHVVFGRASGFGTLEYGRAVLDLTSLAPTDGVVLQGDGAADNTGWGVSAAGDVNGDGYADVIVGVPFDDDGGGNAGAAYVVLGRASGFGSLVARAVVDLGSLAPADGFVIRGSAACDNAGLSVSSAGDVNGDGLDDLFVGAPAAAEAYRRRATSTATAMPTRSSAAGWATMAASMLARPTSCTAERRALEASSTAAGSSTLAAWPQRPASSSRAMSSTTGQAPALRRRVT